jgi:hypothetical protein
MSKVKKVKAAGFNPADLVELATDNPYIHRLLEDGTIRENLQQAIESGHKAIDRLSSAKNPAKALIDDKRVQAELRTAIEAIRDASISLTETPKKKKAKKRGRKLLLLGIGAGAAIATSEGLRTKLLDTLFGAEEEFQYTPPTGTPAAPPAPVSAA